MKTTLFALFMSLCLEIFSQVEMDPCSNLLRNGIFSRTESITSSENSILATKAICDAYNEYQSSKDLAAAKVKYQQIFSGAASYSHDQINSIGKMYCENDFDQKFSSQIVQSYSSYIDPVLMQAYNQCIATREEGIKLEIIPNDYKTFQEVTISMRFVSSPDKKIPQITGILYDTTKFKIFGDLANAQHSPVKLNQALSMQIQRINYIEGQTKRIDGRMVIAPATNLTIQTESKSYTITFPEVLTPKKPAVLVKGVGEIVASMLDTANFYMLYNLAEEKWVLADGRTIPIKYAYSKYRAMVPNLRGMFLRGKNNGRIDGNQNPEGDLELGSFQIDDFKSHSHSSVITNGSTKEWTQPTWPVQNVRPGSTGIAGGDETRPRNITVNYYIRIN